MVLAQSGRGEGRAPFVAPFLPGQAAALHRLLARGGRNFEDESADDGEGSPEKVGERLFAALFPGEILRLYERSLDLLEADPDSGLRLELMFDPRDADLAAFQEIPWELLRQPDTAECLALSRRRPVVRYFAVPRPVYAAKRPPVLRIVTVGANPSHPNLARLNLARELRNLERAVGQAVNLAIVAPRAPTLAGLRQALLEQECHVLHFMGHGGSLPGQTERVLFFETETGSADPVRGRDLLNKLADFPTIRMAVLNACESAKPGSASADYDPFAGVAGALVLGGMPAVVAMQVPISDHAAIAFSRAFYQRLAAGDSVDAAVAEGRQEVHSEDPAGFEWGTPVLFMRTPTGEIYPEADIKPERSSRSQWTLLLVGLALISALFLGRLALTTNHTTPRKEPERRDEPQPTEDSTPSPPSPALASTPIPEPPVSTEGATPPYKPHENPTPETPVEVTLHDGEQSTVLNDQASLAVAFQRIGQEDFITVTVNGQPHAVLGAGARFEFSVQGKPYSVYVLRSDPADRLVVLRVASSARNP